MSMETEFRILGPIQVLRDGEPIPLGSHKQRAVLAILLLHPNEVVSTGRLIDDLWGEEPPAGDLKTLRSYVSRLRTALGKDGDREALLSRSPGYTVVIDEDGLDSAFFERLARVGHEALVRRDAASAAHTLHEALSLWRGPALSDFAYEPFAQAEIVRLEELRLAVTENRMEAELALGRHQQLVSELEWLIGTHPFREGLRAQLMLALYRSGRQAEALAAYRQARDVLVEELGIEPGSELRGLESATKDGHRDVLRPRRLHRACRTVGPGGLAPSVGPVLRGGCGGRPPPRRNDREVHRGCRDGLLRRSQPP